VKIGSLEFLQATVGEEIGVSEWLEVAQNDVNIFADVTRDHQFIHTDPEKAAQTPFGGTIAHGFLSLSLLSCFAKTGCGVQIENASMGINYGFDKVRFVHPVRVGSRVRGRATLSSITEKSLGKYLINQQVIVEIEGIDKPALVAEWLTMAVVT